MKKWSYKTLEYNPEGLLGRYYNLHDIEEDLNQLGSEGWELVNSFTINSDGGITKKILFTLKREKDI